MPLRGAAAGTRKQLDAERTAPSFARTLSSLPFAMMRITRSGLYASIGISLPLIAFKGSDIPMDAYKPDRVIRIIANGSDDNVRAKLGAVLSASSCLRVPAAAPRNGMVTGRLPLSGFRGPDQSI